ncbi:recombinase family protein [Streptomyces sp. NPDC005303]|uniref:recombinase family protein n=1 Tax=Streptomyces sp. NPDC005303 TaxID=3155713 RepID=UPI0033AF71C3
MTAVRLTGREYLRVSFDRSGEERSNDDQQSDNTDLAEELGVTLGDYYSDVGSSSARARTKRGDFTRLMADLTGGTFGADLLVMWEASRGSRQPREWLDLIDACRAQSVKILITTHRRTYDLDQWRDRHALMEESLKAEAHSEETSERVIRTLKRNFEKGKPHGLIPYGYARTYTQVRSAKGRLVRRPDKQLPDPAEALNVIELFTRLASGDSLGEIERDWKERGITTRKGAEFSVSVLSQTARRISYVGKRVRMKTVVNEKTGKRKNVVLGETDAAWPVIADFDGSPISPEEFVELFHEVQTLLGANGRRTNPGGGAQHVFTLTVRCAECLGPMTVTRHATPDGGQAYTCRNKGCLRVNDKDGLDDYLTEIILAYLARPEVYASLGDDRDSDELRTVRAQLDVKRSDLDATRSTEAESLAHEARLAKREDKLTGEIRQLEDRERALTRPNPLAELFEQGPAATVARRWARTPIHRQRAIAKLLLNPELLGEVRIRRTRDSVSAEVRDRVVWHRE